MRVRLERPDDAPGVRLVNERAFGRPQEAHLVESLRRGCGDALSLVAEDVTLVAHVLFTPAEIESAGRRVVGMGLAPMCVVPERQREGIGSRLIEEGLRRLRHRGCPFVVVLGHPEYYPRFGFAPASLRGVRSQWKGVPDEAFLIAILDEGAMAGVSGVARYRQEFDLVTESAEEDPPGRR